MIISVSSNWIIQDPAFRQALHSAFGATFNTEDIKGIQCDGMDISSLSGIEYFENLEWLSCSHNSLTTLDISRNLKLIKLDCGENRLSELNVNNNIALRYLYCYNNNLNNLDISNNPELEILECYDNAHLQIESIDNVMFRRNPYGTGIRVLDTTNNLKLKVLKCSSNEIASLDLSKNSQLLHLDCDDNCIEILDVSTTQLNHYVPKTIVYSEYPLKCKMASLKALYLKRDWRLKGINDTFPVCIARNTQIIYK